LLARDPATHASTDHAAAVAMLLRELHTAGAHDQAQALATRAVTHTPLDTPDALARLLRELRAAGAHDQIQAFLWRDRATRAPTAHSAAVAMLLHALREAGMRNQADVLIDRLPAAGLFDLYCEQEEGRAQRFWFGRDANGHPAAVWDWHDLD
jgi:hypothetical protein